jgi:chromate transporter
MCVVKGMNMMDWKVQRDLFIGFFRAGMLGYGGGPSTIPLVHKEVVERYKWMTDEEFGDILALGNALPGPIATKMAGYIGYRVGGVTGLINALLATVMPTVLLMITLIGFLIIFRDSPVVQGMTQAVSPVVGVMLLVLTYSFLKQSGRSLGWVSTVILGVISLVAYLFLQVHPAILIGILLLYALLKKEKRPEEKDRTESE